MKVGMVALAFVIGSLGVLQGTLNRLVAVRTGLAGALAMNTLVFTLLTVAFVVVVRLRPDWFPEYFRWTEHGPQAWHVLPGLCGALLVVGLPWVIAEIGAVPVFVAIIAAQVVGSAAWDTVVEGSPPGPVRILGLILATIGVLLAAR